MFMPTEEIIDTVHKRDSALYLQRREGASPRDQWEHRDSSFEANRSSLRDEKLKDLDFDNRYKRKFNHPSWLTAPPVTIVHRTGKTTMGDKDLVEGHHRLAHAERAGIPFMAVNNEIEEHIDFTHFRNYMAERKAKKK